MEARHIKETIAGTKTRLARHVENVEVEAHRHQDTGAPSSLGKVQGKVQGKTKAKARNEHLKHVCGVAKKDTRKQTANSSRHE